MADRVFDVVVMVLFITVATGILVGAYVTEFTALWVILAALVSIAAVLWASCARSENELNKED
jgi:quinol-cytochrome oxidoreductase complex cytochrome b subunit